MEVAQSKVKVSPMSLENVSDALNNWYLLIKALARYTGSHMIGEIEADDFALIVGQLSMSADPDLDIDTLRLVGDDGESPAEVRHIAEKNGEGIFYLIVSIEEMEEEDKVEDYTHFATFVVLPPTADWPPPQEW